MNNIHHTCLKSFYSMLKSNNSYFCLDLSEGVDSLESVEILPSLLLETCLSLIDGLI